MTHKHKTLWVLVADEAIARLLASTDGGPLVPAEELTDPDAHARGADLRRDAHGRRNANATSSAGLDETHQQAGVFARRVAERLAQARREQRYDELRIAAAPRFLGLLRKELAPQVAEVVTRELDKDLVHETEAQLATRLLD